MPILRLLSKHWPAIIEAILTFSGCGMILKSLDTGKEDLKVVGILFCLLSIVVCLLTGGVN